MRNAQAVGEGCVFSYSWKGIPEGPHSAVRLPDDVLRSSHALVFQP